MKEKSNRIFYLEVLRVIACLSVIMIHASMGYAISNTGSFNFLVGNIFDGAARIGVPLFVMISGALMLDKNYKFSNKKMISHIKKMIIFLLFWSVVYYVRYSLIGALKRGEAIDIRSSIEIILEGHFHLWFVYMIIGLYLIVPLLRAWVKDENKKIVEYYIILATVFVFLVPQLVELYGRTLGSPDFLKRIVENDLKLSYVGGYTMYFILGWYLHNYDIKNKKMIYILGVVGLFISTFGTYIGSQKTGWIYLMYGDLYTNVLFQGVAVFVFIKEKYKNITSNNIIVSSISKCSLGIYAMHILFITDIYKYFIDINASSAIKSIPIVFVTTFILSYTISFIMNKLPLLKKVV